MKAQKQKNNKAKNYRHNTILTIKIPDKRMSPEIEAQVKMGTPEELKLKKLKPQLPL